MPFFLAIFGLIAAAYLVGRRSNRPALTAKVGAEVNPQRPPRHYRGDDVFSFPQQTWGRVECVSCAPSGCRYGVRFPSGNAVVLSEREIAR